MVRRALLAFVAAGRQLALALEDVQRVLPLPLPPVGAPTFVERLFDFRGTPAATLRIDRLLSPADVRVTLYSPLVMLKPRRTVTP